MPVPSPQRTIARLAGCQVLLLTNGVLMVAVNALAGFALALATIPVVTYVLGAAMSTLPASFFMKRHGRRAGFLLGSSLGVAAGGVGSLAIQVHSFTLLLVGTFLSGIYNAVGQYYRFAVADAAPPDWKSRAISLTLAGGIVGGFIGPAVGRFTRGLRARSRLSAWSRQSARPGPRASP